MCWLGPSANKQSCWSIHDDVTGELQLTGGILHRMVSELMYFTNLISLCWGFTALWGPQSPSAWHKFLLCCKPQPVKGCRAILVCTAVASFSSASSKPAGYSPRGWVGRHVVVLGDNSSFQPFVRLSQTARGISGWEGLCYCSYLCSPASPSPPSSIGDTDFTTAISLLLFAEFLSHSLFCCLGSWTQLMSEGKCCQDTQILCCHSWVSPLLAKSPIKPASWVLQRDRAVLK